MIFLTAAITFWTSTSVALARVITLCLQSAPDQQRIEIPTWLRPHARLYRPVRAFTYRQVPCSLAASDPDIYVRAFVFCHQAHFDLKDYPDNPGLIN